jgi:hypothetical protein
MNMTFEEWIATHSMSEDREIAAEAAWHARDAEVERLEQRLAEAQKDSERTFGLLKNLFNQVDCLFHVLKQEYGIRNPLGEDNVDSINFYRAYDAAKEAIAALEVKE